MLIINFLCPGICFDSGGYNIKTGATCNVELMKFDMGGAGAALGAASAIGALKPKGIEVWNQSSYSQSSIDQGWTGTGEYTIAIPALKNLPDRYQNYHTSQIHDRYRWENFLYIWIITWVNAILTPYCKVILPRLDWSRWKNNINNGLEEPTTGIKIIIPAKYWYLADIAGWENLLISLLLLGSLLS